MTTTSARASGLASTSASTLAVAAGALASFGVAGLLIGARLGALLLLGSAVCAVLAWRLSRSGRVAEVDRVADRFARASRAAVHAYRTSGGPVPPIRFLDEPEKAARRARCGVRAVRTRLAAALHRLAYVVAPSRD